MRACYSAFKASLFANLSTEVENGVKGVELQIKRSHAPKQPTDDRNAIAAEAYETDPNYSYGGRDER